MMLRSTVLLALAAALAACAPAGGRVYLPPAVSTGALGSDLDSAPAGTGTTISGGTASISVSDALPPDYGVVARPEPDAALADAFAVRFLDTIQARSFAERREFCGYFIVDDAGEIRATPPVPGTLASCTQPGPGPEVFASYHTHGAYDPGYDNEVPSPEDLLGDFSFGIDGYVSTPGGRIWRIEKDERSAILVCGQGCVSVDPDFVPLDEAGIRTRYTVSQLRARR